MDSVTADGVKTFKKKQRQKNLLLRFIIFIFVLGLCYVLQFYQKQNF